MDGQEKFWVCIWGMISAVVITIVFSTLLYWINYNNKIVNMVNNGTPPLEAVCALQNVYGTNSTCLVIASKNKD